MAHKGKITINNFHRGQASSPFVNDGAFAYSQGLDVFRDKKGVARLAEKMGVVAGSGDGLTGLPKWTRFEKTYKNTIYMLDDTPNVQVSTDSGATWTGGLTPPSGGFSTGFGQGLTIWKDYLFVVGNTAIDVYGPLSGTPTWDKAWQTLSNSDVDWHPCLWGLDDKLYIGHGNDIASIAEVDGQDFNPDTAGTYTFTDTALDLPEAVQVKCLENSIDKLLIGTWKGSGSTFQKFARIYPWDMESPSFDSPIIIDTHGINAMKNINGNIYVAAGIEGRIYVLRDTFLEEVVQIPQDLSAGGWVQIYPDAINEFAGKIVVGVSLGGGAIYSGLFTLDGKRFCFEFIEGEGAVTAIYVPTVFSSGGNSLIMGIREGTARQIHAKNTSGYRYTSYSGLFESLVYQVGSQYDPMVTSKITVRLARALQTGEGVKVKYRTSYGGTWLLVGTRDLSTDGALTNIVFDFTQNLAGSLEVRVELTTGGSSANTPLVHEVVVE